VDLVELRVKEEIVQYWSVHWIYLSIVLSCETVTYNLWWFVFRIQACFVILVVRVCVWYGENGHTRVLFVSGLWPRLPGQRTGGQTEKEEAKTISGRSDQE